MPLLKKVKLENSNLNQAKICWAAWNSSPTQLCQIAIKENNKQAIWVYKINRKRYKKLLLTHSEVIINRRLLIYQICDSRKWTMYLRDNTLLVNHWHGKPNQLEKASFIFICLAPILTSGTSLLILTQKLKKNVINFLKNGLPKWTTLQANLTIKTKRVAIRKRWSLMQKLI